jgi:lysophospholipase L1-like esterase
MIGGWRRWLWRAKILCAALVVILGFDVPLFGAVMVPVALAAVALGTFWLLRLLVRPAPGESAAPPRRKQIALLVGTSVLMVVLLLGTTATIRLGGAGTAPRGEWRPGAPMSPQMVDPELGWSPFGPPDVVGQRLERVDPARPHVLLMGDSILYGLNLSDEEHVGRKLEALMPGYQVLNASVSGYSIDQYLLTLERVVPVVKPKVVVLGIFTGNDFQITSREFSWGNHKPVLRAEGDKLVRADVAGPCVDRLSRSILFRVLWQSREVAADTIESICRPIRLRRGEAERSIAAMFDAIDRLCAQHGARVLHVLLPVDSEYNTHARDRYLYVSRHYDLWRILGEKPRERFDFSADLFRGGDMRPELFFEDHAHLRAPGHELLASAILREITARGLLPR